MRKQEALDELDVNAGDKLHEKAVVYSGLIDLDTLIVDNTIINRGEYEYKTSISNLYKRI